MIEAPIAIRKRPFTLAFASYPSNSQFYKLFFGKWTAGGGFFFDFDTRNAIFLMEMTAGLAEADFLRF